MPHSDRVTTIDEMVAGSMSFARDLARQCRDQGVDDDELESEAMLALTRAAQRYRPGGYDRRSFRSWAEIWIIRGLRKLVKDAPTCRVASIPVRLKRQASRVRVAAERLAARGIRRPTVDELAYEAMLTVEEVELVQTIPGVAPVQGLAEYADHRGLGRPANEPDLWPAFGAQPGFTPLTTCANVHSDARPIAPDSLMVCMVCHATGEVAGRHPALRRNRATDPKPERRDAPAAALRSRKPGRETRRERRRRLFPPMAAAS